MGKKDPKLLETPLAVLPDRTEDFDELQPINAPGGEPQALAEIRKAADAYKVGIGGLQEGWRGLVRGWQEEDGGGQRGPLGLTDKHGRESASRNPKKARRGSQARHLQRSHHHISAKVRLTLIAIVGLAVVDCPAHRRALRKAWTSLAPSPGRFHQEARY